MTALDKTVEDSGSAHKRWLRSRLVLRLSKNIGGAVVNQEGSFFLVIFKTIKLRKKTIINMILMTTFNLLFILERKKEPSFSQNFSIHKQHKRPHYATVSF